METKRMSDKNGNYKVEEVEKEETIKMPGFRFHPTDEELVSFYLKRKVEKKKMEVIKPIDIYKYDPWDLPKVGNIGEKEWYYFCMRGRKYRNSIRPNRVTGSGFWKATGIDKPIHAAEKPHECIGLKKSLVYYRGNAGKGTKTDWMMHEFRLPPALTIKNNAGLGNPHCKDFAQEAEIWTLCRIFKRIPSHRKYTPDSKQNPNPKPFKHENLTPSDSCSKTNSGFDSEHSSEFYVNFGDSAIHSISHPTMPQFSGPLYNYDRPEFWIGDDRINYENDWDELRSVVERAINHF